MCEALERSMTISYFKVIVVKTMRLHALPHQDGGGQDFQSV